ncbi:MAG: hypothetical protein R3F65_20615 [bacterium]
MITSPDDRDALAARLLPSGALDVELAATLDAAALAALWQGARGRAHEAALLHLVVVHPGVSEALLVQIAAQAPGDVLEAIVTGGRATAAVLDGIEAGASAALRRSVRLARFGWVLDGGTDAEIAAALVMYPDEVGQPAHYLAACHPRTPRAVLEALAGSDEAHVAAAARERLSGAPVRA